MKVCLLSNSNSKLLFCSHTLLFDIYFHHVLIMFLSSLRVFAIFSIFATLSSALPHLAPEDVPEILPGHQKHQIGSRLGKRATAQDYLIYAVAGINQLQVSFCLTQNLFSPNILTRLGGQLRMGYMMRTGGLQQTLSLC